MLDDEPAIAGRPAVVGEAEKGEGLRMTLAALSSNAITSAPPATNACALASPEPPSPNSASFFPAKLATGIIAA